MRKHLLAAALALGLTSHAALSQQPALETDEQKTLYALGVALGVSVEDFGLTEEELEIVEAGLGDSVSGAEPRVDMQTYGPLIQPLANERVSNAAAGEKTASEGFLSEMAARPGAERLESGVVIVPDEGGDGANPTASDTVRVHYHGTLRDGTVFDSSVERGEPVSFELGGVIPCWTEALQRMQVGGKATIGCPSDTAYGDQGRGEIPGGAALAFEVELLGIGAEGQGAPE